MKTIPAQIIDKAGRPVESCELLILDEKQPRGKEEPPALKHTFDELKRLCYRSFYQNGYAKSK